MKSRLLALVLAAVLAAVLALDLLGQASGPREEAIVATALDYSDGGYSGDAARMERAIHPDLNKVFFMRRNPTMGLLAGYSTFSGLVEMTRMNVLNLEPEKRRTDVAVLESTEDVACVRLRTSQWCDYLQMIKDGGRWKIVNVLWTAGLDAPPARRIVTGFDAEKERPAAQAAALDYLEGMLAGDAARLERALHPETCQIVYMTNAGTGAAIVNRTRYSGLLEPAKAKVALAPENARQAEVRVLDLMDGMAFAAARTARGAAYLQLQLADGQWKVINVLVRPNENSMGEAPPKR
jgi:hypothetical protein